MLFVRKHEDKPDQVQILTRLNIYNTLALPVLICILHKQDQTRQNSIEMKFLRKTA